MRLFSSKRYFHFLEMFTNFNLKIDTRKKTDIFAIRKEQILTVKRYVTQYLAENLTNNENEK